MSRYAQDGFGRLPKVSKTLTARTDILLGVALPTVKTIADLQTLYEPIAAPLEAVKKNLNRLWQDALALVGAEYAGLSMPTGKMLRPALCLLSAGAIGAPNLPSFVPMATAFEALHIASLTHDDVIDHAFLRRGTASLNALWNNHAAILAGDYLVARAVEILATYGSCGLIADAIRSVRRMAEGELYFFGKKSHEVTEADCVMLAQQKTAALFAEAVSAPTHVHGAQYQPCLHAFGMALGTAFQIMDDLLDLTQPSEQIGKPSCGDLVEGKRTVPILYLYEKLDDHERQRLEHFRTEGMSEEDRQWVRENLEAHNVITRTLEKAHSFIRQAKEHLSLLSDSPYRESMEGIAEFIVVRTV